MLSAANWAHHLHTRGNFEAYVNSASKQKWLEVHGLEHWSLFYSDYGVEVKVPWWNGLPLRLTA